MAIEAFSGDSVQRITPCRGKSSVNKLFSFIQSIEAGGGTALEGACQGYLSRNRTKGVAVIISDFFDEEGFEAGIRRLSHFSPNYVSWENLDLNYETVARIDQDACIKCGLCHIVCEDTAHQAVRARRENGARLYEVIDDACVGCNLCALVCPVEGCITMERVENGKPARSWLEDPRNPANTAAAE